MKLKNIFKLLTILLLMTGCTKKFSKISFEKENIDLGMLKGDTLIEVLFKPKNIGKSDLVIERVSSDCHCTVPRDFQKVISPNEEGVIKVTYNSSRGFGYFEQLIEVFSNAENSPSLLRIKGRVDLPNNNGD